MLYNINEVVMKKIKIKKKKLKLIMTWIALILTCLGALSSILVMIMKI